LRIEGFLIGTIQHNKKTFYVEELATAPENFYPDSSGPPPVKGVGRALINHLEFGLISRRSGAKSVQI
jgi:hypothetical protein